MLVLAGLDPSGGAGLVADGEAILAAGARPLLCATAITIQTTARVRGWHGIPAEVVTAQALALAEEEGPIRAVKLGMLGSAAPAVARLKEHPLLAGAAWVVDPVLFSSSGAELVEGGTDAYRPLLERGPIVTPNAMEAGAFAGLPEPRDEAALLGCARRLVDGGAAAVLAKGGHLDGEPVDWLVSARGAEPLRGTRRPGSKRGTGCRLASFLAARLALGEGLFDAARDAKRYVAAYLDRGASA
ncbi:hydroxymethylpyrimidine/phosphomethylpyrimidine kinase [Vulgatibacter incomptus]|uniref:hydroxymethylpyrimidine kinase n=1 Tax=Vulgatibacter incomptus TaxID=1391653 RepID=A0A0K1PEU5_9BACT|nr:hydroxymethylpyrimidine/phosphomethylpyrimidine kinase [Vulgatibacter incomptus]AKU91936.1 Phosphomethylpyrimidine kinase [Vulgatibacter incomptus]